MSSGPVGMTSTPIGTVFLYEMESGDLSEYERQPYEDSRERVRWLLSRVASKSSAGDGRERPAMLSRAEVAALGDEHVEEIADVFLTSPGHEWHARKSRESGALSPRADGEPATGYLDRLVRWRASLPAEVVARRPADVFSPGPLPARAAGGASTPQLLTWVSAGLAIAVLLSAASLAFAAMSYFEAKADHQANELWRGEMRRLQETKAPGPEKLVAELAAENARLRYRLELREGGKASPPAKAPVVAAKPATRSPPKYSTNRSGRQAAR